MTEGIIQKVIHKYILNTELQYESKNVAYQIKQELIEEIKKELVGSSAIYTWQIRNKLIGDNQE